MVRRRGLPFETKSGPPVPGGVRQCPPGFRAFFSRCIPAFSPSRQYPIILYRRFATAKSGAAIPEMGASSTMSAPTTRRSVKTLRRSWRVGYQEGPPDGKSSPTLPEPGGVDEHGRARERVLSAEHHDQSFSGGVENAAEGVPQFGDRFFGSGAREVKGWEGGDSDIGGLRVEFLVVSFKVAGGDEDALGAAAGATSI